MKLEIRGMFLAALALGFLIIEVGAGEPLDGTVRAATSANSFDYPVGKPNASGYYVALDFGTLYLGTYHPGEDWNCIIGPASCPNANGDLGDPVYAVANGTVVASNWYSCWGNIILIRHDAPSGSKFTLPDGRQVTTVWSQYAHLDRRDVVSGDVSKGQQIGTIGIPAHSDCGTVAHLHFEIRYQDRAANAWVANLNLDQVKQYYVDPSQFIDRNRQIIPPCTSSDPGADQVVVFENPNYSGACSVRGVGNYPSPNDMGIANDSISSVKVGSDVFATLCADNDYQGGCSDIQSNDSDLGDTPIGNDRASSLKVTRKQPGCSTPDPGQNEVVLFVDPNFGGACSLRGIGNYPTPQDMGIANDSVSSVKLGSGVFATLCQDNDFKTNCSDIRSNDADLGDTPVRNDQASSLKVVPISTCAKTIPDANEVILFEHTVFGGFCEVYTTSDPNILDNGHSPTWASSIRVGSGVQALLCQGTNYGGTCEGFTEWSDGLGSNFIGNDSASSIRIDTRPTNCPGGYLGWYFNTPTPDALSPARYRCDAMPLSMDWGTGAPIEGVRADNFSVRWRAVTDIPADTYEFYGRGDDGIRVWLQGELIIDQWTGNLPEKRVTRTIPAGQSTALSVEYVDTGGNALAYFGWSQPDLPPKAVIKPSPVPVLVDQDDNGCETITLDGSGSSDPEGKPLSYEWIQHITEKIGTEPTLTKCFPVGYTSIELRVTDPGGKPGSASDVVTVTTKKPSLISPDSGDSFPITAPPTFCWQKINSAIYYRVGLWREDEVLANNPRSSDYISDTCWTPTLLDAGYTYYWVVEAYGGVPLVRSGLSEQRSVKITDGQPNVTLKIELGIYDLTDPYLGFVPVGAYSPNHLDRTVTVQITDNTGAVVTTKTVTAHFDSAKKAYLADAPVNLALGTFQVKVRLGNTLMKRQAGFFTIGSTTTTVTIPRIVTLIGDVDGNNLVNILDYNILVGCFSVFEPPKSCSPERLPNSGNEPTVDLNDDGKVDLSDLNLIYRVFVNQQGD